MFFLQISSKTADIGGEFKIEIWNWWRISGWNSYVKLKLLSYPPSPWTSSFLPWVTVVVKVLFSWLSLQFRPILIWCIYHRSISCVTFAPTRTNYISEPATHYTCWSHWDFTISANLHHSILPFILARIHWRKAWEDMSSVPTGSDVGKQVWFCTPVHSAPFHMEYTQRIIIVTSFSRLCSLRT